MQKVDLPEWLLNLVITGREGENDEGEENNDEGDNGEDNGEEGEGENGTEDNSDDNKPDPNADAETRAKELEKALNKERKLRREAEREARRATRRTDKDEKKGSEDEAEIKKQLAAEQEKITRLATSLRNSAIEAAILEAARDLEFIDPTDALTSDVRKAIEVDQDDEDPADIDIDTDSVVDAVKALASKKKHLVGKGAPREKSGGKFRKKSGSDKGPDLGALYPGLR